MKMPEPDRPSLRVLDQSVLPQSAWPFLETGIIGNVAYIESLNVGCDPLEEVNGDSAVIFSSNDCVNGFNLGQKVSYAYLDTDNSSESLSKNIASLSEKSLRYSFRDRSSGFFTSGTFSDVAVSIIVPVYNVENYIERCARSLITQKFDGRYEILFVNDGSTDKSIEKLEKTIADSRVAKILNKRNGGAADARNFGLKLARGEFIAFVDGDDYVSCDYLEVLYRAAKLNNAEVSQASFAYVDDKTGFVKPHIEWFAAAPDVNGVGIVSEPAYQMMLQTPGIWRRLYSRRLLSRAGIKFNPSFRRHDDLPFNISVLCAAEKVAIARDVVYFYVLGRDGQDVGATDERLFIHFRLFADVLDHLGHGLMKGEIHKTLLRTMFGHHMWAYERIESRLKAKYLQGVGVQLFGSRGRLSAFRRYRLLKKFDPRKKLLRMAFLAFLCNRNRVLPSDL